MEKGVKVTLNLPEELMNKVVALAKNENENVTTEFKDALELLLYVKAFLGANNDLL